MSAYLGDTLVTFGTFIDTEINGIVQTYKVAAGESISAGDFVSWLNGKAEVGTDKQLSSTANTIKRISAVSLNENKVFIAYGYGSAAYLYGVVCTFNGDTITVGTETQLSNSTNTGDVLSAVKLAEDKVFIAHRYDAYTLYAMVCTINGTTITKGTDTPLNTTSNVAMNIKVASLSNSKVFVTYAYNSSDYILYGVVCTISGTTISVGANTQLSSILYTGRIMDVVVLDDSRVFIAHSYGNNYYLYGMVCTITNTTIKAGTDTALDSSANNTGSKISAVLLSKDKVFIAHSSTNYYLHGVVCTIDGTTMTTGKNIMLSTVTYSGAEISVAVLDEKRVFIAHSSDNTNRYLNGLVCSIDGTTISVDAHTELNTTLIYSGTYINALTITKDKLFVVHSGDSNYKLYGMVVPISYGVTSLSDKIFGVAKTGGSEGKEIQVYVPG